jgi:prepilin-type N-terminal cleavage/methylation domain-containing protein
MMARTSTICSRRSRQAGLTLVEVLAAVVILGTILVGVVVAKARHTRQLAVAREQTAAVHAVDGLIARWWADTGSVPVGASGTLGQDASITWQTFLVANPQIAALGARVVRVEVHGDAAAGKPLFVVDLVVPAPEDTEGAEP